MFPNCLKFADALDPIARSKDIDLHFKQQIMSVDGANRVAEFKNLDSGEMYKVDFDLLHVVPPQTAPKFIRDSTLAAENGWLDVNMHTLQHSRYANIYGLGDVCNLPTAKTAAGVFT
jgi:sulfide:quinone oxidoreductase